MRYDLTPLAEYLQTESPKELARVLDEAMYDVVLSAEQVGLTEGLSRQYFTLKQLRDLLWHLRPFSEHRRPTLPTHKSNPHS